MTESEFIQKCKQIEKDFSGGFARITSQNVLEDEWRVGGEDGGSCYGGEPSPIIADPEPELLLLEKIILGTAPKLGFLQWREMVRELSEFSERTENEYYGNWTRYCKREISLHHLYDFLSDHGLV